jgi:imidazolonepropionase-like amidohydrolase
VDQAVAVGVEGIEHASSRATEEQLAALAASGIAVCPTLGGFNTKALAALAAVAPRFQQIFADAGLTPESFLEIRMLILRKMATFGVRLISGDDAGIGPDKAHGRYAEAVIELEQVTGTVPALVAASSDAAAAIGLGRSKGRLRRRYDADLLVVGADLAADLTALRDVRQVVLRGMPVSPRSGQSWNA